MMQSLPAGAVKFLVVIVAVVLGEAAPTEMKPSRRSRILLYLVRVRTCYGHRVLIPVL